MEIFLSIFVGIGSVLILFLILSFLTRFLARFSGKRSRDSILDWAAARDWNVNLSGARIYFRPEVWTRHLPRGDRNGVRFELDGTWQGRRVTVVDYWYQTTSTTYNRDGDHGGTWSTTTTVRHVAVIAVRLSAQRPAMALERRGMGLGWGLGLSRVLGHQASNLTGNEEFDRRFRIRAPAPVGTGIVPPQLIVAHLAARLPLWRVSVDQLLIISRQGTVRLKGLDERIDQAVMIAGLLDSAAPG
jgi:hypothetical protein